MAAEEPGGRGEKAREPTRRLFFALWPDEAMRQAMAHASHQAARGSGGRPVPEGNLHVTLAFLGAVPERRLAELAEIARGAVAQLRGDAVARAEGESHLALAFDHLEYWRAAQLLCALPAEPPARMVTLARTLQELLAERGFAPDLRSSWSVELNISRPFRPHVTLARKVRRRPAMMAIQPVTWGFTDFVLVDSKTLPEGSIYTVLERFAFALVASHEV